VKRIQADVGLVREQAMAGNELGAIDAPARSVEAAVRCGVPNLEDELGRQAESSLQASMNGSSAEGSASRPGSVETGTVASKITGYGAFLVDAVESGTQDTTAAFADVLV
jgi:hypothetical protein